MYRTIVLLEIGVYLVMILRVYVDLVTTRLMQLPRPKLALKEPLLAMLNALEDLI